MICPNLKCGKTVIAPDSSRGKVVRCVHCRASFIVPKGAVPEKPQPPAVKDGAEKKKN